MLKYDLSKKEDLMRLAHEDPRYLIEAGFMVINKDKQVVPFLFNDIQNAFYDERTIRDDLLKPGQIGMSTMILAILTIKFLLVPNAWCVCISHEAEATARLFEKVQFFLDNLPVWLKPFYKPSVDSKKNLVNGVMNSRFYIGTAGAIAFGRGDTIHYAHLSEVSRWKDSGAIATGIIRAVPVGDPHSWIVKETTANGVGTYHHTEYERAKRKQSEFTSHFFPWFMHKEYAMEVTSPMELTDEEQSLMRRFPDYMTMEKLQWRRKMIGSLNSESGWTPEQMFKQEFPSDDVEAFLFTGNPVFPVEAMQEYTETARKPIWVGNLNGIAPYETLDETKAGYLKIYKMPKADGQYLIFSDVGQFSDHCSAHILDRKTWEIAAVFNAQIKSNHFGTELNKLGYFYNKAIIAPEANNMGQSTTDRLVELDYPNIYQRERFNQIEETVTNEYGWWTDAKTKSLIIGNMQDLVRTRQVPYIDEDTVGEMITYIKKPDGSMGATKGKKDDRVISICGAYYLLRQYPFVEPINKKQSSVVNKKGTRLRELRTKGLKRRR